MTCSVDGCERKRNARGMCHTKACRNGHDITLPDATKQTPHGRLCVECSRSSKRRWAAKHRAKARQR